MTASRNPYVNPNALLNDSLRIVTAVRERLPEIIAVANRMTDVDDLVQFQHQVNYINKYLALLVEASEIIIRISPTGFKLITAATPTIARAVLELGSAALRPEEYFATKAEHDQLATDLASLVQYVNEIALDLATNYATKEEVRGVRQELVDEINRLSMIMAQIGDKVTELDGLFERVDNLSEQSIAMGTQIGLLRDNYELLSTSHFQLKTTVEEFGDFMRVTAEQVTTLESKLTNVDLGLTALATAQDELRTQVTRNGDDIQVLSEKNTALESSLVQLGGQVTTTADAQNTLTTRVDYIDGQYTAVSNELTQLGAQYTNLETGLQAQANATEELRSAVEVHDDKITVLSDLTTKLSASLKSYNNLVTNSDFSIGVANWTVSQRGPGWELPEIYRDVDPATMVPAGTHTIGLRVSPAPSGSVCIQSDPIAVRSGSRYFVQSLMAGKNLTVTGELAYYDLADQLVPFDGQFGASQPGDGGMSLDDWPHKWREFGVPVGAVSARIRFWGVNATGAPAEVHILRPMLEEGVEGQTLPSQWSPSVLGMTDALAEVESRLRALIQVNTDGITALSEDFVRLTAELAGKADAEAVNQLITQVSEIGGELQALSAQYTQLIARIPPGNGLLATEAMIQEEAEARANAIQAVATRTNTMEAKITPVGAGSEDIGAGSTTVYAVQRTIQTVLAEADHALSVRIDELEVGTGQEMAAIKNELIVRMDAGDELLAQQITTFRAETETAMATLETTTKAYVDAAGVAMTQQLDVMKADIEGTMATAVSDLKVYVDQGDQALASAVTDLHSQMGVAIADAKTELKTYVDNQGNSISQQITTLQTEFTGVTQAMIARTETLENGMLTMSAKYMLNVSAGNRIGGMSLANDGNVVDVVFLADNFNIVSTSTTNGIEIRNGYLRSWGGGAQAIMGNGFGVDNNLMFFIGANVGADNAQLSNALIVADNHGNLYVNGIIQANKIAGQFQTTGGGRWTGNIPANTGGATPSITFDAPNSNWGHRPYITLEVTLENEADHSRDGYIILQRWDSTQSLWVNVRRKYFLTSSSTITTNIVMVIDDVRYDAQQYRVKTEVGTSSWGSWALWEVQMFIVGIK